MQDQELNKRLKQMWAIETKLQVGDNITKEEKEFFNAHLKEIKEYYEECYNKWIEIYPLK